MSFCKGICPRLLLLNVFHSHANSDNDQAGSDIMRAKRRGGHRFVFFSIIIIILKFPFSGYELTPSPEVVWNNLGKVDTPMWFKFNHKLTINSFHLSC